MRVLQSFPAPRATSNPYVVQLLRGLAPAVEARPFSWSAALLWRYDVLHLHWPDAMVTRRSRLRQTAVRLGLVLTLLRVRARGTALVRTAHNVEPHEPPDRWAARLLRQCDRWTTWWIRLNDMTPTPDGVPVTTVLHADYRDWFADHPRTERVPGRVVIAGSLRPYKGVEELLDVFTALDDPGASLAVVGRPTTADLRDAVETAARDDRRVLVELQHVDDASLAAWLSSATLVVLPYRTMHNSGAALLALSLRRPVLVPANEVTDALAAEVGETWVQRFAPPLTTSVLRQALVVAETIPASAEPSLAARAWETSLRAHVDVYLAAAGRGGARRAHGRPRDAEVVVA